MNYICRRGREGFTSAVLCPFVMCMCRSMCATLLCCPRRACAETRRGERHRNSTVSLPDPTWYLYFFICLTGKDVRKQKHTRTHIYIYIYTYIHLYIKKNKIEKRTLSLEEEKGQVLKPPFMCTLCVHVPGCRSFLCPEAGASLCCHFNNVQRHGQTAHARQLLQQTRKLWAGRMKEKMKAADTMIQHNFR